MVKQTSNQILIIGAGEVGMSTAKHFANEMTGGSIHIRTLSDSSLQTRLSELKKYCPPNFSIDGSTGDIFFSVDFPTDRSGSNPLANSEYLLAAPSPDVLRQSSIFNLIEKVRPTIIIDTVNATHVTRSSPISSLELARELISMASENTVLNPAAVTQLVSSSILSNGSIIIARYIAALELALREFDVIRYVRVSTTGLCGMGFNCPYTHGESNTTGVGEALEQKLATSGALHQFLWNLHHTSSAEIALVIPAALIGWEKVQCGPMKSKGKLVPLLDRVPPETANYSKSGLTHAPFEVVETVYAPAGDSSHYTIEEMALATSIGQFEAITKEEVARAVYSAAFGDRSNDLLTFMDKASLGPSYAGAIRRTTLLEEMRNLAREHNVVSIASGNFGPAISKALFELHFILKALGDCALKEGLLAVEAISIATTVEGYVLEDTSGRPHALSLGHSITFNSYQLSPREMSSPGDHTDDIYSIDLRTANIAAWQRRITSALPEIDNLIRFTVGVRIPSAGEILAGTFIAEGKRRHLSIPLENTDA